jgi:DNA-binding response OmpR family regulator
MKPLILLAEDEEHLARGLCFNFQAEGYGCIHFERGDTALERLLSPVGEDVGLVVLDVMLPGMSGLELLRRLREAEREVPVLMLTARDAESDVVRGLDMGADDYLSKPFALPVLLARVRTLLRRSARAEEPAFPARFSIGEAIIYPDRFEIERAGERLPMTAKELGLLQLLYARRGSAVSRGEILHEVWDLHPDTRTRVVDTFVRRLRKLIEPDPGAPRFLLSVRTYGYKLVTEAAKPPAAPAG